MTELMHKHLMERGMIARGDRQLVIDATATIGIAVDQHDDVLERHTREHVIQAMDVLCHQVAVAVESVIMGTHGSCAPPSKMRHTGATGQRLGSNGDNVEAILERGERLMGKQGIDNALAVAVELAHLFACIALSDNRQVNALGDVRLSVKRALSRRVVALARLIGSFVLLGQQFAFPDVM